MDLFAILIFCIYCLFTILILFRTIYVFYDQYRKLKDKDSDFK
jgi:hypothetical protein